jgi:hypothetical protein
MYTSFSIAIAVLQKMRPDRQLLVSLRHFDVKSSGSEPTPSTAVEVKATAEGASLRPEGLGA